MAVIGKARLGTRILLKVAQKLKVRPSQVSKAATAATLLPIGRAVSLPIRAAKGVTSFARGSRVVRAAAKAARTVSRSRGGRVARTISRTVLGKPSSVRRAVSIGLITAGATYGGERLLSKTFGSPYQSGGASAYDTSSGSSGGGYGEDKGFYTTEDTTMTPTDSGYTTGGEDVGLLGKVGAGVAGIAAAGGLAYGVEKLAERAGVRGGAGFIGPRLGRRRVYRRNIISKRAMKNIRRVKGYKKQIRKAASALGIRMSASARPASGGFPYRRKK